MKKNAYDIVNNLVNTKLEKNKINIENANIFEKNKIWLQDFENITYKYWENDNSIVVYYGSRQHTISFDNKLFSDLEISNIKLSIKRRVDNIKTYEYLKNKLNNITNKVNNNLFNLKTTSKATIYNDDYENVQVSIDVNNTYICNEVIFNKTYKINEINLDTILTEVEKSLNDTKVKFEHIYNTLNKFKIKINGIKNEYYIEIEPTYCVVYSLGEVEYIVKYSDVNNVNNLLKRKIFKKCSVKNISRYYEDTIAIDVINGLNKKYKKYVKGNWNIRYNDGSILLNGNTILDINYNDLDTKEKLYTYLNYEVSNKIREERYGR